MLACTRWISPQNCIYSWSCDPVLDLEIDGVELIDSTRLKIDRLDSAEN